MGKIPGVSLAALFPKAKPGAPAASVKNAPKGADAGSQPRKAQKAPVAKRSSPRRPDPPTLVPQAAQTLPEPLKGAKAVAKIWERIEPEKIAEMAGSYRDPQLARILNGMSVKKSAAILAAMDAKRAALLCQEMEKQASLPLPASEALSSSGQLSGQASS